MNSKKTERPARPLRRVTATLLTLAVFGIGLHLIAPTLNGLKLAGVPLGYAVSAQIGPICLALILVWMASRKVAS